MFSFAKSTGYSLLAHALAFWGLYAWPLRSTDRMTFSGSRQVVSIEATAPQENVPQSTSVEITSVDEPPEEQNSPEPEPLTTEPPEPREESNRQRLRAEPTVTELKKRAFTIASQASKPRMKRRLMSEATPKVDNSQQRQRRELASFAQPVVSMPPLKPSEQDLGVDNRTSVDLSGNPPPVYPAQAVQQRLQGTVLLRLNIAADGSIERVAIQRTSGHAILDQAAIEAVRQWQAKPATEQNRAVATEEVLPIKFRL